MNIRIGALVSILAAASLACGGAASSKTASNSPDSNTGGNVTLGFSSEALTGGADLVTIVVTKGGVAYTTVTQAVVDAANVTLPSTKIALNLTPDVVAGKSVATTFDLALTATLGSVTTGKGHGTVIVPASGAVFATINILDVTKLTAQPPAVGFVFGATSMPAFTADPTAAVTYSVTMFGDNLSFSWTTDANCTATLSGFVGAPTNASPGTSVVSGSFVTNTITVTAGTAQVCTIAVKVTDNDDVVTAKYNASKSITAGFGATVGLTIGETPAPTVYKVILADPDLSPVPSCTVSRVLPADQGGTTGFPAVPASCDAAGKLNAAYAAGVSTIVLKSGTTAALGGSGGTYAAATGVWSAPSPFPTTIPALPAPQIAGSLIISADTGLTNAEIVDYVSYVQTGTNATFTLAAPTQYAHASGAAVALDANCEFAAIKSIVGSNVCTTPFTVASPADAMVAYVFYDLNKTYSPGAAPLVTISGCGIPAATPVTGIGGQDNPNWYRTSANPNINLTIGMLPLTFAQPAAGACTLTATVNNQGAEDSFPIAVDFQAPAP